MTYYLRHPDGTVWCVNTRELRTSLEWLEGKPVTSSQGTHFKSREEQEEHADQLRAVCFYEEYSLVKLDLDGDALCIKPLNFENLQESPAMFIEMLSPETINELRELGDFPPEQRCRVCGCTECTPCIDELGEPCSWVEEDLCSACADKGAGQ